MMSFYLLGAILALNIISILYFMRVRFKGERLLKKIETKQEDNKIIIEVGDYPLRDHLEEIRESLSIQLKQDLHNYINFEEEEQGKWGKLIAETQDNNLKRVFVEAAFYRYPNNVAFFDFFYELLMQEFQMSNRNIKKIVVGKAQQLTQYFINHCAVEDIEYAYQKEQEVLDLSKQYMKDVVAHEEEKLEKQINSLEELVSKQEPLEKIQQLDATINKAVLEHHPSASEKYNELLRKVTENVINEPSEQQVLEYNRRAISQAQEAENIIKEETKRLQKEKEGSKDLLPQLANKLGGWEDYYLTNPTQTYVQAVYSHLFGLLAPNLKPELTKFMLKVPKKEIFS